MICCDIENLGLILTAQCNSHCSYCYQTAKKPASMCWDTLKAAIELAFHSSSRELKLLFLGGEPLLEWAMLREAVEYAVRNAPPGKQITCRISTNGLLITDEIVSFLDRHKFQIQLSFDGIAEAQNHRREGTFTVLDQLLDRLRERWPDLFNKRLCVGMTQIPATLPYLADSIRYLARKGVREISLSPSLTPVSGWEPDRIQELDTHFQRVYEESLRHFQATGQVPLRLLRKEMHPAKTLVANHGACGAADGKTLVVDVDGRVYGCSLFAESYQEFPSEFLRARLAPLRMGDLLDERLPERHAAYRQSARSIDLFKNKEERYSCYGRCGECPCRNECFVCPISIGYDSKDADPKRVPDFICAFNRTALKYCSLFPCMPDPLEEIHALFGIRPATAVQTSEV